MKKFSCLMAALFMCAGLLVGCQSNGESPAETLSTSKSAISIGTEMLATPEELAGKMDVQNISPYEGIYLEAGDEYKSRESNVYALKVTNNAEETILNAALVYSDGTQKLTFYVEMLPVGKSVYVVERNKKTVVSEELTFVEGTVNYLEAGMENMECVEITGTDESSLMIENLTEEILPCVWIFYRKLHTDGTLLGGVCYSTMSGAIEAEETIELEAESWMDTCVIVNVLVLDDPGALDDALSQ